MTRLLPGDPAPWFTASASNNPRFVFASAAGRYIVLCFYAEAADLPRRLAGVPAFDDAHAALFAVSTNAAEQSRPPVSPRRVGLRYFWDFDRAISDLYGIGETPVSVVLDPNLRILTVIEDADVERHAAALAGFVSALPPIGAPLPAALQAPILVVPRIFERDFCRHLIGLYDRHGGEPSGFMREEGGKTVLVVDPGHKRRSDYVIEEEAVRAAARARIKRRLVPEIRKAFQFEVTRMERYIVACYDAGQGGYFRPHRDNTTKGTAHRRFAVTLNLNEEDYEGGNLRFPEYGPQLYRAPTGGAVVFSCSLLHEATPVTRGTRYVFLPFLYDEAAAELREQNNRYLAEQVGAYRR